MIDVDRDEQEEPSTSAVNGVSSSEAVVAGVSVNGDHLRRLGPLESFLPKSFRPFVRRNYQFELMAAATWPIAVAMVEGPVTGVIAKKSFVDTPDWVIATLTAAPAFCNISSFLWTRFAQGRSIVRSINVIQLIVLSMILVITFIPLSSIGLYVFLGAAIMARFALVGVITLRSVLWRTNYARFERARVTGKIITIQTLVLAAVSLGLGRAMDYSQESFRVIFPFAILSGLFGVWAYSLVRVRRPFLITTNERSALALTDYGQPSFPTGVRRLRKYGHYLTSVVRGSADAASNIGGTLSAMWRVLHDDLPYRGYMVCMSLTGIGNLAIMAPLVLVLTEKFNLKYTGALVLLQSVPLVMMPITIPLWSRYLDRVHVIRFRAVHVWVFVIAHALTFWGALTLSIPLMVAGQMVRGIGFGGGALAWNIGHNDFSSRQDAGLYMTIHVTLTGVRGAIAGYLGIIMYSGIHWGIFNFPALQEYSFVFWACLTALGALGFMYLNWKLTELTRRRPIDG